MTDLLQRSIGPSVALETRFPLVTHPVLADANQLEMALLNLVVNARDALPEGGKITIATRKERIPDGDPKLKPGNYICLTVRDNGMGMDAETLKRATEPFYTTKGIGKGTGLGLSMVHGVTEQFGGCFTLHSEPGKGTTAEVWLPVADTTAMAFNLGHADEVPNIAFRPLVVLAVDDDFLVLTNTLAMLEDLGHTALEATSAIEALEVLASSPVDLVITDQAMPNMTGLQLASTIQAQWPQIPIIIATGYAEMGPGKDADLPKLAKPFTEADLKREIERVVLSKGALAIPA